MKARMKGGKWVKEGIGVIRKFFLVIVVKKQARRQIPVMIVSRKSKHNSNNSKKKKGACLDPRRTSSKRTKYSVMEKRGRGNQEPKSLYKYRRVRPLFFRHQTSLSLPFPSIDLKPPSLQKALLLTSNPIHHHTLTLFNPSNTFHKNDVQDHYPCCRHGCSLCHDRSGPCRTFVPLCPLPPSCRMPRSSL